MPPFESILPETADDDKSFRAGGAPDAPASQAELWEALVSGRWLLARWEDRPDSNRWLLLRRVRRPRPLTPREREVARRIALGEPNKTIAIDLGVTTSAVARTLNRALGKLRLRSRLELALLLPGSAAARPRAR